MTELEKLNELMKDKIIGYEMRNDQGEPMIVINTLADNKPLGYFCERDNGLCWWTRDILSDKLTFVSTIIRGLNAELAFNFIISNSTYRLGVKINSQVITNNKPDTQQKIRDIMDAMKDLLLYKNKKYGDSAINPKKIFYKGDSTNSILIRLDDKLGRVMSNTEEKPRVNDVADIIGYCTLLLISMDVTAEDIAKFKD